MSTAQWTELSHQEKGRPDPMLPFSAFATVVLTTTLAVWLLAVEVSLQETPKCITLKKKKKFIFAVSLPCFSTVSFCHYVL